MSAKALMVALVLVVVVVLVMARVPGILVRRGLSVGTGVKGVGAVSETVGARDGAGHHVPEFDGHVALIPTPGGAHETKLLRVLLQRDCSPMPIIALISSQGPCKLPVRVRSIRQLDFEGSHIAPVHLFIYKKGRTR